MRLTALFIVVVCLVCGCANQRAQSGQEPKRFKYVEHVRIESNPPGLRVFIAYGADKDKALRKEEYVGTSPCVAEVDSDERGRFYIPNTIRFYNMGVQPVVIFTARPDTTNLFTKEQIFKGEALLRDPDTIPEAIFFDATKP